MFHTCVQRLDGWMKKIFGGERLLFRKKESISAGAHVCPCMNEALSLPGCMHSIAHTRVHGLDKRPLDIFRLKTFQIFLSN